MSGRVGVDTGVRVLWPACGQRTTFGVGSFVPPLCVLWGIELGSSGFTAGPFYLLSHLTTLRFPFYILEIRF